MIDWIAAAFLFISFILLVRVFGLVQKSQQVLTITRQAMEIVGNKNMDDDEKEKALRRHSLKLFGLFGLLLTGGAAAVFLPIGILWLADRAGWLALEPVFERVLSPVFLISAGLISLMLLFRPKRVRETSGYSVLDRMLHRIAFSTYTAQLPLADLETQLFKSRLTAGRIERPLFITSLPRAGTTLLLEICSRMPQLSPPVLCRRL